MASQETLRIGVLTGALLLAVGAFLWNRDPVGAALWLTPAPAPPAPTHLFVVMDTVRADTTSLCGHPQPTTPVLEALAARPGAAHSCRAYTPGAWTLPSHASYFTGRPVLEHRAHFLPGHRLELAGLSARVLDDALPTLAEELAARGYQTVALSGNPVVGPESGLARGFQEIRTGVFGVYEDETLVAELRAILPNLDGERPLFLFVNLSEAHSVLDDVPAGHPWLPAQENTLGDEANYWRVPPAERDAFAGQYQRLYEHGVERADRSLAGVIDLLSAHGWLDEDSRIVVTTDHGEVLGEHGMFGHGRTLWEGNNRGFLVAVGFPDLELPEPVSALEAHALLRDGALAGHPVEAVAFADEKIAGLSGGTHGTDSWTGRWEGREKFTWREEHAVQRVDLGTDPEEDAPQPAEDARVEALAAELLAVDISADEIDPGMLEMLRAAGYVE